MYIFFHLWAEIFIHNSTIILLSFHIIWSTLAERLWYTSDTIIAWRHHRNTIFSLTKGLSKCIFCSQIEEVEQLKCALFARLKHLESCRGKVCRQWILVNSAYIYSIICVGCFKKSSFQNTLHYQWKSHWTITIPGKTQCFWYIMTVQNTVYALWITLYKLSTL
jgi:hypothetical protein